MHWFIWGVLPQEKVPNLPRLRGSIRGTNGITHRVVYIHSGALGNNKKTPTSVFFANFNQTFKGMRTFFMRHCRGVRSDEDILWHCNLFDWKVKQLWRSVCLPFLLLPLQLKKIPFKSRIAFKLSDYHDQILLNRGVNSPEFYTEWCLPVIKQEKIEASLQ